MGAGAPRAELPEIPVPDSGTPTSAVDDATGGPGPGDTGAGPGATPGHGTRDCGPVFRPKGGRSRPQGLRQPLETHGDRPVTVRDVGEVQIGAALKRGTGSVSQRGPNWEPLTRSGAAWATAANMTSIMRRIVSV